MSHPFSRMTHRTLHLQFSILAHSLANGRHMVNFSAARQGLAITFRVVVMVITTGHRRTTSAANSRIETAFSMAAFYYAENHLSAIFIGYFAAAERKREIQPQIQP